MAAGAANGVAAGAGSAGGGLGSGASVVAPLPPAPVVSKKGHRRVKLITITAAKLVANVIDFFFEKQKAAGSRSGLTSVNERAAAALKLGTKMISKVKNSLLKRIELLRTTLSRSANARLTYLILLHPLCASLSGHVLSEEGNVRRGEPPPELVDGFEAG